MDIRSFLKRIPYAKKVYRTIRYSPQNIAFRRNLKRVGEFDKVNGTDFGGRLYCDEIGVDRDRANDYSPSPVSELKAILKKSRLTENDAILDMGCGKGYAMYVISQFKIRKVGGVELSESLCRVACENLTKVIKEVPWEVSCCDAGTWDGYDEYNIFYIYNSFPKVVMEEVKNRIDQSIKAFPRNVVVWYLFPEFPEVFENDSEWELVSKGSFMKRRNGMHVFKKLL